jgi:hypothetical protein
VNGHFNFVQLLICCALLWWLTVADLFSGGLTGLGGGWFKFGVFLVWCGRVHAVLGWFLSGNNLFRLCRVPVFDVKL